MFHTHIEPHHLFQNIAYTPSYIQRHLNVLNFQKQWRMMSSGLLRRVVLTRAIRRNNSEDTILHSHRCENLKSYISKTSFTSLCVLYGHQLVLGLSLCCADLFLFLVRSHVCAGVSLGDGQLPLFFARVTVTVFALLVSVFMLCKYTTRWLILSSWYVGCMWSVRCWCPVLDRIWLYILI
jgi:hypothetical protein